MKSLQFIGMPILFFFMAACVNNEEKEKPAPAAAIEKAPVAAIVPDSFPTGKVITSVVCKNNASYSYALYVPVKSTGQSLPVIYLFDPHGDGFLPVNKYKVLADRYHFILIGSNNSKNGNDFPTAENIWNTTSADSKQRLKIDPNRIYVCGFSGGAKVAGYIALNHAEVKSVIVGGAGLPDNVQPANFRFSLITLAGEGDLNMTDLVAFNNALDKTQTRHRVIFFDGKHEWSPENKMDIAFASLQLDAMRDKTIVIDNSFVSAIGNAAKQRLTDYLNTKNYLKANEEGLLAINLLDGAGTEATWFKEKTTSIQNSPAFKKQSADRQNLLAKEQSIKAGYQAQFASADMNYWKSTIAALQAGSKSNTPEAAMNQRLIAYLSLAFYSIGNQLIKTNQDKDAAFFVELYKTDDATNPEGWYLSAILNARNNNGAAAKEDLLKAVANGFADKTRLEQQSEFQTIRLPFAEIEAKMKN